MKAQLIKQNLTIKALVLSLTLGMSLSAQASSMITAEALANQGSASAQYNLATMYNDGDGAEQDNVKAFTWYKKAAEQGHIAAQNHLGSLYQYGLGVEQDSKEAVKWYRKAA